MEICTYRGREGFARIEAEWRQVTDGMRERHFHHLYEWHRSCLDSVDDHENFYFVVARRAGKPVVICPLRAGPRRMLGIPLRVLDQLYMYVNCDFVYDKCAQNAGVLAEVVGYLQSAAGIPHDLLLLEDVREDASVMFSVAHEPPRFTITPFEGLSASIRCDRPYREILSGSPRKFRANLRTAACRLAGLDGATITDACCPGDLAAALPRFLDVEASGWKGAAGSAIKLDEESLRLYEAAARHFGAVGGCEISLLWAEGRCIAGQFSLVVDGTLAAVKIGYDETYAHVSPGHLLFSRTLERCCDIDRIHSLNLISDPPADAPWGPVRIKVYRLLVCNPRPLSLLVWRWEQLRERVRALLRRF